MLPFGLKNGPSVDQRIMTEVSAALLCNEAFCYIGDIVNGRRTLDEHPTKLTEVVQRLKDAGFLLEPSKCHFGKSRIRVLGLIAGGTVRS